MGRVPTRQSAAAVAKAATLQARALELRTEGLRIGEIAVRLGVTPEYVGKLVRDALRELFVLTENDARHLRALEEEYLQQLWGAVVKQALEGNVAYVEQARKIRESYRKLMGLDAPAAPLVDARQQTLIVTTDELARYDALASDPAGLAALEKFARGYAEAAEQEPGQD